jgi:protocatechuate 3,4-dioxygenase, alpha subunit
MSLLQTPSQTVGPYFTIGFGNHVVNDISASAPGEAIELHLRVFDGVGEPVPDAVIETWQADPAGVYAHTDDPQASVAARGFHGFMRAFTEDDGSLVLKTVRPGRVAGPDGALQAPHLVVNVLMRGLLKQAPTRLYFADDASLGEDPILALVPADRRQTLLARRGEDGHYHWDIRMQGAQETVFFDY